MLSFIGGEKWRELIKILSPSFFTITHIFVFPYLLFNVLGLKFLWQNSFIFVIFLLILSCFLVLFLPLLMESLTSFLSIMIGIDVMVDEICVGSKEESSSSPFEGFDDSIDEYIFFIGHVGIIREYKSILNNAFHNLVQIMNHGWI